MDFVTNSTELFANATMLADAIHDGDLDTEEAAQLVSRGRVFLRFRYGNRFAFAPAKFIGYRENSIKNYKETAPERSGTSARAAVNKVMGRNAVANKALEKQLENYCSQIGVELRDNKHSFWTDASPPERDRSAIHDIDASDLGNSDPEYRKRMAGRYVRDEAVRKAVLLRAAGRCEFCGELGFESRNGLRFLEAHHVISLSEEGPDKVSNVIALCPNDHRRAHIGIDWQSLQDKFLSIVQDQATP